MFMNDAGKVVLLPCLVHVTA